MLNIMILYYVLYCVVQQQLTTVANIKRLTSEREDLLTKLQYCENNLKTAIECKNSLICVDYSVNIFSLQHSKQEAYLRHDGNTCRIHIDRTLVA